MSMRKTGRKLPAYCEHKPTGQAYVRVTVDGKRQTLYLGKYNSRESLAEYDRIVGKWVATKSAESKTKSQTIGDIAERYKSHQEPLLNRDKLYINSVTFTAGLLGTHVGWSPSIARLVSKIFFAHCQAKVTHVRLLRRID